MSEVGTFALLQGVGTGVLSTVCYVVAVKRLGAAATASAGAVSPVLLALVAVSLLGEAITAALAVALAFIVTGVALYNLAFSPSPRRSRTRVSQAPNAYDSNSRSVPISSSMR